MLLFQAKLSDTMRVGIQRPQDKAFHLPLPGYACSSAPPLGIRGGNLKVNLCRSSKFLALRAPILRKVFRYSRTSPATMVMHQEDTKNVQKDTKNVQKDTKNVQKAGAEHSLETTANYEDIVPSQSLPERVKVVLLCFAAFVLCNCDRINISVAILPMASTFMWSQSTVGVVQSAFFCGYITTQVLGGYLSDRYGGRPVLAFGVVSWSLMTLLTPIAASTSFPALLAARVLLGVGEGVAMPAMNQVLAQWVPRSERSKSVSLVYSGMYLGSTVGLLSCPSLISHFGWPSVFYFFGGLGAVWYLLWSTLTADSPQKSTTISASELTYISQNLPTSNRRKPGWIPWKLLLSEKATWAIIVAHFCCTWGYFVLLTWLPTYFSTKLGFDLTASAYLSFVPWVAMFLSANLGGIVADNLLTRGLTMTNVRKLMQTIGFLGPGFFLALVGVTSSPAHAVAYMTLALALGSFSQSGVYSNHQDIGPSYAGVLLGISNTAASIPGIVGVALTGVILDSTGSWKLVFDIAIAFYLLGTAVYLAYGTGERVFD